MHKTSNVIVTFSAVAVYGLVIPTYIELSDAKRASRKPMTPVEPPHLVT